MFNGLNLTIYYIMVAFPDVNTNITLTLNGSDKNGTLKIGASVIPINDYTNAGSITAAINAGQTAYTSETNKPLISELTAIQTALKNRINSYTKTGSADSKITSSTIKAILDKLSFRANITTATATLKLKQMIDLLKTIEGNTTSAKLLETKTAAATVKDEVDKAINLAKDAVPKAESTTLFKAIKAYTESVKDADAAKTLSTAFTTFAAAAAADKAVADAAAAAGTAGTTTEEAVKKACNEFFATTDVIKYFEDTNLDILTVPNDYIAATTLPAAVPTSPATTSTTSNGGKSHKTRRSKAQKRRKTARRY